MTEMAAGLVVEAAGVPAAARGVEIATAFVVVEAALLEDEDLVNSTLV